MKDMPDVDWINYQQQGYTQTNKHYRTGPHAAPEDKRLFLDGWFDTSMPDINPEAQSAGRTRYLMQNSVWWVEYAALQGFVKIRIIPMQIPHSWPSGAITFWMNIQI